MPEARSAKKSRRSAASTSRVTKFLTAGVAVVGAGTMAIGPVTPTPTDIRTDAVTLTAAAEPISLVQQSFAETLLNLQLLGINASNSSAVLTEVFGDADLFGELTNVITLNASNPTPLLTKLLNFQALYGEDIQVGLFGWDDNPATPAVDPYDGVFDRLKEAVDGFVPLLANILTHDPNSAAKGTFNQAFFEANRYFVLNILDTLRPLSTATPSGIVPLLSIPGDFLNGLPGVENLDGLVNAAGEQGAARGFVGPFLTAGFQFAKVLDDTLAALAAGNNGVAVNELVNLPVRVTNAFVNGFTPDFSPGEWPSLLSGATLLTGSNTAPGGLQFALVTATNDLIRALGGTPPPLVTTLPTTPATPATTGARVQSLAASTPAADAVAPRVDPAPQVVTATADTAQLAGTKTIDSAKDSATAPGASDAIPVKKPTSTFAQKTQEALKKAQTDVTKNLGNLFKPKTKETATTTTGGTASAPDATAPSATGDASDAGKGQSAG